MVRNDASPSGATQVLQNFDDVGVACRNVCAAPPGLPFVWIVTQRLRAGLTPAAPPALVSRIARLTASSNSFKRRRRDLIPSTPPSSSRSRRTDNASHAARVKLQGDTAR